MTTSLWTVPVEELTVAERVTLLRWKASVMDLLADVDPTVSVIARETACELRCTAVLIKTLIG
ncbi:hypothetical protein [Actinocrispum sp. NPDC049592]|uniref:hypothetical protein n=1 Tax=Actinocrispum sp. NPDC049592 TaxID=3154835 RepID=UPI003431E75F